MGSGSATTGRAAMIRKQHHAPGPVHSVRLIGTSHAQLHETTPAIANPHIVEETPSGHDDGLCTPHHTCRTSFGHHRCRHRLGCRGRPPCNALHLGHAANVPVLDDSIGRERCAINDAAPHGDVQRCDERRRNGDHDNTAIVGLSIDRCNTAVRIVRVLIRTWGAFGSRNHLLGKQPSCAAGTADAVPTATE